MMQNPTPTTGKRATHQPKLTGAVKRDINLLPINENSEKMARRGTVALAVLAGALVLAALVIYLPLTRLHALQRQANLAESQVAEKKHFEAEFNEAVAQRNSLQEMLTSLENINSAALHPADIVSMLSVACPDKVTLVSVTLSNGSLSIAGRAETDTDIAQFLVNLRTQPKIYGASLVGVQQDTETTETRKRVFDVTVNLTAPGAEPKPASEGGDGK